MHTCIIAKTDSARGDSYDEVYILGKPIKEKEQDRFDKLCAEFGM